MSNGNGHRWMTPKVLGWLAGIAASFVVLGVGSTVGMVWAMHGDFREFRGGTNTHFQELRRDIDLLQSDLNTRTSDRYYRHEAEEAHRQLENMIARQCARCE